MESYPGVLVGTDGSTDATVAVRLGGVLAGRLGVPLEILTAYDGDDGRDRAWAEEVNAGAVATAKEAGADDVKPNITTGDGPDVLLETANAHPERLVVVGSSGLSKASSRILGSTSNRLAHHALADVLYARDPLPTAWNFVALATDGSKTSLNAVRRGIGLAKALKARPRLVTAQKSEEQGNKVIAETVRVLQADIPDIEVESEVIVDSDAAAAIVAKGWKWEVVVIGNKSMSGAARLLGSIANKVTHGLDTNLLLVNTTRS